MDIIQKKTPLIPNKISRQKWGNPIVTVGLILFLLISFFVASGLLKTYSVDSCLRTLEQETMDAQRHIYQQISSVRELLDVLAEIIQSEGALDSAQTQRILASYKNEKVISRVGILFPDNRIMQQDGTFVNPANGITFDELAGKGSFISNVEPDYIDTDNPVLFYNIPIQIDGEIKGILFGVVELKNMSDYFELNAFDGNAAFYIFDAENDTYIIDTLHGQAGNPTGPEKHKIKDGYSEEQVLQDFTDGNGGVSAYLSTSTNEYLYTAYEPSGINKWFVMLTVPERIVFQQADYIRRVLFWLGIFESIVLIAYFLCILIRTRREMNAKESEIKQIHYMYDIQKILFDAYRQPENMELSLMRIAQAVEAESVLLAVIEEGNLRKTFSWIQENAAGTADKKQGKWLAEGIAKDMQNRNSEYIVTEKGNPLPDNEKIQEIMKSCGISNLMAVPLEGQKGQLIGVLAASNMKYSWITTEPLSCVTLSFSMALYNMLAYRTIEKMGTTDSLTNLMNRNAYEHMLELYETEHPNCLTCVYADANGLHELNNSQGHAAGDKMLKCVAYALVDAFEEGNVYRIGGDEFLVFTEMDEKTASEKAAEVKKKVSDESYHVSVGTASGDTAVAVNSIVKTAEQRMYEDKRQYYMGKNDRRQMR